MAATSTRSSRPSCAALNDMVTTVQVRFPGHRFRRVSGIDDQHGELRFAWELATPDGSIVVAGIDVGGSLLMVGSSASRASSARFHRVPPSRDARPAFPRQRERLRRLCVPEQES